MPGGTILAIENIASSEMMPGPDGIRPTNPKAEAPYRMAIWASSRELMQQIFIRIILVNATEE